MITDLLTLLATKVAGIEKVSARNGGEYHSPCPSCGGTDRFICFPEQPGGDVAQRHGLTGTWSCPRHCQTGGDVISFLMTFDGLSFADACKELGIVTDGQIRGYRPLRQPNRKPADFTPHTYKAPVEVWCAQAGKLATKAHARLLETPNVLAWLARRGLPLEAVLAYGLGYIEGEDRDGTCIFRARESFGLPTILKENGKPKKLRIPRGVTIPVWASNGGAPGTHGRATGVGAPCLRIRIRKRNADIDPNKPRDSKYLLVPQPDAPYSAPLMLAPEGVTPELATWVVTEAELDAMAVHHACEGRVGTVSVLTVAGKPDEVAHCALSRAARILVALDFDNPAEGVVTGAVEGAVEGAAEKPAVMPAAQAWPWWQATYPQARLWPVPEGKDPGDAFALGVNLREWVDAGMPSAALRTEPHGGSIAQPQKNAQETPKNGDLGALNCGQSLCGERDCSPLPADTDSSGTLSPVPLRDIPADVLELAQLWQGLPVRIRWLPSADGRRRAMKPEYDSAYGRDRQRIDAFLRRIWSSSPIWEWLAANSDDVVTAENFIPLKG